MPTKHRTAPRPAKSWSAAPDPASAPDIVPVAGSIDGADSGTAIAGVARLRAWIELTKPGITRLVVVTAAAGFYLAGNTPFDVITFVHTLIGVGLTASGASALNQFIERDADRRMRRTARRPLPTGRVASGEGFVVGATLALLGLLQIALFVNLPATLVVAASLFSYLLVYTPLKTRTWHATVVGAVPGALPILAGWTAGGGALDARGLALFAIVFLWQMPHFFALAWMYREDYMRGGFRMLSAFDSDGSRTARQIMAWTIALVAMSLLPAGLGMAGPFYAFMAVTLGLLFLAVGAAMLGVRNVARARRVFLASVFYLPVLLGSLVLDRLAG